MLYTQAKMTDINPDRVSDLSPVVGVCTPYIRPLRQAFFDFADRTSEFDRIMGAPPGTVDESLQDYLVGTDPIEIAYDLSAHNRRNDLARRAYNLCLSAQNRGIDPATWYDDLPTEIADHIRLVARVKELKEAQKVAFNRLTTSVTTKGKQSHTKSLQLQQNYIAARKEYQEAFDRMWVNLITLEGAQ